MMRSKGCRAGSWLTACLLITLAAGCSGKPAGTELPADSNHIKNFANLVANFRSSHTRAMPKSIEELKAWLKKEGKGTDEDCISPRDNQDYVIYGGGMGRFIVYEQTGIKGKRYMVNPGGAFVEATDEQIEKVKNTLPNSNAKPGTGMRDMRGGGRRGGRGPQ